MAVAQSRSQYALLCVYRGCFCVPFCSSSAQKGKFYGVLWELELRLFDRCFPFCSLLECLKVPWIDPIPRSKSLCFCIAWASDRAFWRIYPSLFGILTDWKKCIDPCQDCWAGSGSLCWAEYPYKEILLFLCRLQFHKLEKAYNFFQKRIPYHSLWCP